ncbi:hypothetical protein LTR27_011984 [Elasticomyces elasticus]|nr:hypothetical protein LTR27_011984 [Elasticomyces elasticus]
MTTKAPQSLVRANFLLRHGDRDNATLAELRAQATEWLPPLRIDEVRWLQLQLAERDADCARLELLVGVLLATEENEKNRLKGYLEMVGERMGVIDALKLEVEEERVSRRNTVVAETSGYKLLSDARSFRAKECEAMHQNAIVGFGLACWLKQIAVDRIAQIVRCPASQWALLITSIDFRPHSEYHPRTLPNPKPMSDTQPVPATSNLINFALNNLVRATVLLRINNRDNPTIDFYDPDIDTIAADHGLTAEELADLRAQATQAVPVGLRGDYSWLQLQLAGCQANCARLALQVAWMLATGEERGRVAGYLARVGGRVDVYEALRQEIEGEEVGL